MPIIKALDDAFSSTPLPMPVFYAGDDDDDPDGEPTSDDRDNVDIMADPKTGGFDEEGPDIQ